MAGILKGQKKVYVYQTPSEKKRVIWTSPGSKYAGRSDAKVTDREGHRNFPTVEKSIAFGKRQAIRMGAGTRLLVERKSNSISVVDTYFVRGGKLVRMK